MPRLRSLLAVLAFAAFLTPGFAGAQSASVSEQDLRAFAAATAKIRLIDRDYTKKKDGKSAEERTALSAEENKANLAAVQGAGLTPERYNAVSEAIQNDPALAQKAYDYIYAAPLK